MMTGLWAADPDGKQLKLLVRVWKVQQYSASACGCCALGTKEAREWNKRSSRESEGRMCVLDGQGNF